MTIDERKIMLMQRMKMMTIGFVLMFLGLQLNLVNQIELTPRFSTFLSEHGTATAPFADPGLSSTPFSQASYGQLSTTGIPAVVPHRNTVVTIPDWLCWPTLFLGTVLVLQGAIKRD